MGLCRGRGEQIVGGAAHALDSLLTLSRHLLQFSTAQIVRTFTLYFQYPTAVLTIASTRCSRQRLVRRSPTNLIAMPHTLTDSFLPFSVSGMKTALSFKGHEYNKSVTLLQVCHVAVGIQEDRLVSSPPAPPR